MGSGTSAAVSHKMNRQYIGIKQMDYIKDVAVERLKKVIGKNTAFEKEEIVQTKLFLVADQSVKYSKFEYDKGGISKARSTY